MAQRKLNVNSHNILTGLMQDGTEVGIGFCEFVISEYERRGYDVKDFKNKLMGRKYLLLSMNYNHYEPSFEIKNINNEVDIGYILSKSLGKN